MIKIKKLILVIFVLAIFLFPKNEEFIRIRVLANSNSEYDQQIKTEVVDIVTTGFNEILSDEKDIDNARAKISANLDKIETKVDDFLTTNNVQYDYKVKYGLNYFPPKEFKGISYDEGYYESVLITVGEGAGDNWWCILFPSICLTEENGNYQSIIKNIYNKIFY